MSEGLNPIDITILIVIILSSAFGLWRGLVKEVLSLLTWVAAMMVARLYNEPVAELFSGMTESPTIRYVSAFAILFIGTMLLGTLVKFLVAKLIDLSGLKAADKILGAGFGFARGALIIMIIMYIARAFVAETEMWQQSVLIPYGEDAIVWSQEVLGDMDALALPSGALPQIPGMPAGIDGGSIADPGAGTMNPGAN